MLCNPGTRKGHKLVLVRGCNAINVQRKARVQKVLSWLCVTVDLHQPSGIPALLPINWVGSSLLPYHPYVKDRDVSRLTLRPGPHHKLSACSEEILNE